MAFSVPWLCVLCVGSGQGKPLAPPIHASCALVVAACSAGRQEAACAPWLMLPLSLLHCQLAIPFWALCHVCLVEEHAVNEWLGGGQSGGRAESGGSLRQSCCSSTACRCAALLAPAHGAAYSLLGIASMPSTVPFTSGQWVVD